jgi:ubiquinone/menaquinone biosynthesis C-methylase UbiE
METPESAASLKSPLAETEGFYSEYYAKKGTDRNSLLHNPSVLFQVLAQDAAMIRALQSIHPDSQSMRVLDVGCGDGASLWLLLRLGFQPSNLVGVDIQEERILKARARHPHMAFECADATCLRFKDGSFDMVMESTMFIHATEDMLARGIAEEMMRVTKVGGILLLSDWRYAKPRNPHYKAVTVRRISDLFQVGKRTTVGHAFRGSLLPPVGRLLSGYCSSAYFLLQKVAPFLAGHVVTILRKTS